MLHQLTGAELGPAFYLGSPTTLYCAMNFLDQLYYTSFIINFVQDW